MITPLRKPTWIERVKSTDSFHKEKLKLNIKHRIQDTAKELNRSIGSISNDLQLAKWLVTHERQLERFRNINDALDFVAKKKLEVKLGDL